jgi:hypothetical protein
MDADDVHVSLSLRVSPCVSVSACLYIHIHLYMSTVHVSLCTSTYRTHLHICTSAHLHAGLHIPYMNTHTHTYTSTALSLPHSLPDLPSHLHTSPPSFHLSVCLSIVLSIALSIYPLQVCHLIDVYLYPFGRDGKGTRLEEGCFINSLHPTSPYLASIPARCIYTNTCLYPIYPSMLGMLYLLRPRHIYTSFYAAPMLVSTNPPRHIYISSMLISPVPVICL